MRLKKFLLMVAVAFFTLGTAFAFEQKRVIVSPITGNDAEAQKRADAIFGALKVLVSKQRIVHLVNRSDVEKILSEMSDQQSGNYEKVEQLKKISNAEWIIFGNLAFDSVSSVYNLTLEMVDLSANTIATASQSESKGSNSLNNLLEKAVDELFDPPKPNGNVTIEQEEKSRTVRITWQRAKSDKRYEYKVLYSDDPNDLIDPYLAEDDAEKGSEWITGRKTSFEVPDANKTYYYTVLVRNQLGVCEMYPIISIPRDAKAQFNLAEKYYYGEDVEMDYTEAFKWYRMAAEQGYDAAQNCLGDMYLFGEGIEEDDAEAMKWYRKSAEQGNAEAQYNLGYMYRNGYGVVKDYEEAVKWYRKSAEQGYARGQYNLGYMYEYGYGVSKDDAEAVKWYRKSAEQGYAAAQYNLGHMYRNGYGVSKDYTEAAKWYRKAAEQGDTDAQNALDDMYRKREIK